MNVILVDTDWSTFLPLTYTRPVSKLPLGAFTIAEKWEKYFGLNVSYLTQSYLKDKFPTVFADINIYINSSVIPNSKVAEEIKGLSPGKGIDFQGSWIAFCGSSLDEKDSVDFSEALSKTTFLRHWWNLFYHAETYIKSDFEDFFKGYPKEVSDTNLIIGFVGIFILLFLSAIVSGAEVALFSLSQKDIEDTLQEDSSKGKIISNSRNFGSQTTTEKKKLL